MFLTVELIINLLGFASFVVIAVLIMLIIGPQRAALTQPFYDTLDITHTGILLALVVAVLIAVVFLINALYITSLIVNSGCALCWTKWQSKSFTELIKLFGFLPSGARADGESPELRPEDEEAVARAMSPVKPKKPAKTKTRKKAREPSEEEQQQEEEPLNLNPIRVRKLPKWNRDMGTTIYVGFALNDTNHWSLRGNIPRETFEKSKRRKSTTASASPSR